MTITGDDLAPEADRPSPDERAGMKWWNGLSEAERLTWLQRAGSTGRVADAWEAYKKEADRAG